MHPIHPYRVASEPVVLYEGEIDVEDIGKRPGGQCPFAADREQVRLPAGSGSVPTWPSPGTGRPNPVGRMPVAAGGRR
jgi:hypothetical protein